MLDAQLPTDRIREFVIAGHFDLPKVQAMLADTAALLNAAYAWKENDRETAIQAAAHVGNVPIAEFLLAQGAPLEICTAAMLGRLDDVRQFLGRDPDLIHATGAHQIPLLTHAALSGNLELVQWLFQGGAQAGLSAALFNAVSKGDETLTRWFLENGQPELSWRNYEDKTALAFAREQNHEGIVQLLHAHGATE